MREAFVLLTAQRGLGARLFRLFTFAEYSHVSIGLDEEPDCFFGFVLDGLHRERPLRSTNHEKRMRRCALYRLEVSEEIYETLKHMLDRFQTNAEEYRYSYLGVMCGLLRIPHQRKNRYFCSQFVSELLLHSGAMLPHKQPALFFPDDFAKEPKLKLCFRGTLGQLAAVV
jgi:hypothetical protein